MQWNDRGFRTLPISGNRLDVSFKMGLNQAKVWNIYIYIIIILLVIYEYTVADIAYKLISVWDLAKLVGFPILYQNGSLTDKLWELFIKHCNCSTFSTSLLRQNT